MNKFYRSLAVWCTYQSSKKKTNINLDKIWGIILNGFYLLLISGWQWWTKLLLPVCSQFIWKSSVLMVPNSAPISLLLPSGTSEVDDESIKKKQVDVVKLSWNRLFEKSCHLPLRFRPYGPGPNLIKLLGAYFRRLTLLTWLS